VTALDRGPAHRDAVDGGLALAAPQGDTTAGPLGAAGEDESEGRGAATELADLAGDGRQHAVGAGPAHTEAGVQGSDEGGRTGSVDPEETTGATSDDGVSGEDFTAVGHALQPNDPQGEWAVRKSRHAVPPPPHPGWVRRS
jgi:hypothetical protein